MKQRVITKLQAIQTKYEKLNSDQVMFTYYSKSLEVLISDLAKFKGDAKVIKDKIRDVRKNVTYLKNNLQHSYKVLSDLMKDFTYLDRLGLWWYNITGVISDGLYKEYYLIQRHIKEAYARYGNL